MKAVGAIFLIILSLLFISNTVYAQGTENINAQEIIRQIETQYTGETSYSMIHMKIVTDIWTRELTMESWSEGRDKFLARILAPQKERNTATLKIEDDMWNYLPKIDRLMKIPSSLMGDSWMGSHFTNDDLVKENKIDELYTFEIETIEDSIATIICTPKPDAAIVWDKVIYSVDLTRKIPVSIDYYDEDDELVRTMKFDRVENISERWIPMRMVIRPIDKPDEMTELIYETLSFDVELAKDLFSISSLRRQ
ncbi:outer membrane lipoprotein-sorting protein [Candidatus Latescibacterota bacterium]